MARRALRVASNNQGSSHISRLRPERGQGSEHPTGMGGGSTQVKILDSLEKHAGAAEAIPPFRGVTTTPTSSPSFATGGIAAISITSS